MKKFLLLLSVLFVSVSSFADEYDSLAVDAVSKFSQIGSAKCEDKTLKVELLKVYSKEVGSHVEAMYSLKLGSIIYKVVIIDGMVTSITVDDIGNAG